MINIEIVTDDDGVVEKECDTFDEAINYLTAMARKQVQDEQAKEQAIEDARDNPNF